MVQSSHQGPANLQSLTHICKILLTTEWSQAQKLYFLGHKNMKLRFVGKRGVNHSNIISGWNLCFLNSTFLWNIFTHFKWLRNTRKNRWSGWRSDSFLAFHLWWPRFESLPRHYVDWVLSPYLITWVFPRTLSRVFLPPLKLKFLYYLSLQNIL